VASAAIDVSDGLFADLSRILEQSRVGGALDIERLPLAPALIAECGRDGAIELALSGGDDYELCFTVESAARNTVDAIATQCDTALTRIGTVRAQPGLACLRDGVDTGYQDAGFRHFR
jgi:thiamine-monophosphate kinase